MQSKNHFIRFTSSHCFNNINYWNNANPSKGQTIWYSNKNDENMRFLRVASVLTVALSSFYLGKAQNSMGVGTETPNPNAVLELVSPGNNQGFLVPRLSTAQRTDAVFTGNLSAADNGLMVFDSDEGQFYFWVNDGWQSISNQAFASVDTDSSNELQTLTFNAGVISLSDDPGATTIDLSAYDANAADDFDGAFGSLTGVPVGLADGDDVNDADADPLNEIQDLQLVSNQLSITGNATPTVIDLAPFAGTNTDEQDLAFNAGQITLSGDPDATVIDLSNYDTDVTDDFDGTFSSLTGVPAGLADGDDDTQLTEAEVDAFVSNNGFLTSLIETDPTVPLNLKDGVDFSELSGVPTDLADGDDVNDADSDPANEIQNVSFDGTNLSISGGNSVDISSLSDGFEANTDEQDLVLTGNDLTITGDPTPTAISLLPYLDNTDAQTLSFDGSNVSITGGNSVNISSLGNTTWGSITGIPAGFADGTDNIGNFPGSRNDILTFSGDEFELYFNQDQSTPANIQYGPNGAQPTGYYKYAQLETLEGAGFMIADVKIPNGSTITRIIAVTQNPNGITANLELIAFPFGSSSVSEGLDLSFSLGQQPIGPGLTDTVLGLDAQLDYEANNYYVQIAAVGAGEFVRVFQVRIEYTYDY